MATTPGPFTVGRAWGNLPGVTARRIARELSSLQAKFGPRAERRKRMLLEALVSGDGPRSASDLLCLHESLLFVRAYPDSAAVMDSAEHALRSVASSAQRLARHDPDAASDLEGTGIAGTSVRASFSLPVVRWLLERFPSSVTTSLGGPGSRERLAEALPAALLPVEAEAVVDGYLKPGEWLRRGAPRASGRGKPAHLGHLFDALPEPGRSAVWGALGLDTRWDLGEDEGSRTLARAPAATPSFRRRPFHRSRVDLRAELRKGPFSLRRAGSREARSWKDLAVSAVTCRYREMHTFVHASLEDVLVAEAGHGLRFAVLGVTPEARHPLRAFYGFLIVKNGVPIGYGDAILLFEWGEINFHIFDTYRQAESARTYAALLRVFHQPFGLRYLFLNPYQFGHRNEEAIASGAFWFYEKLGFRPTEPALERSRLLERRRLARDPAYRSPGATLRRLARGPMELVVEDRAAEATRRRYRGFHPMRVALAVSRAVALRHGGDREAAAREATHRLRRILGGAWSGSEAAALERLAPALDLVPDLGSFSPGDLGLLSRLVRAKAGRSEREYLALTRRHARVRDALLTVGGLGRGQVMT